MMKQNKVLAGVRLSAGSVFLTGTLLVAALALGGCGGGAATSAGGGNQGGVQLDEGGSAGAVPACTNIPQLTPNDPDHITAFQNTVYPLVRTYCTDCHDTGDASPKFAHSDPTNAYNLLAIGGVVDLCEPSRSRLVSKLSPDQHNCWGNCADSASAMQTAITQWAIRVALDSAVPVAAIQSTPASLPADAERERSYTLSFNITDHVAPPAEAPEGAQSLIQIDAMEWDNYSYLFSNPRYAVGTPVGGVAPSGPDGAALYASTCEGCHGPVGTTTVDDPTGIRAAIDANRGGMGTLVLSAEDEAAIAGYLQIAGEYFTSCGGCHGDPDDPENSNSKKGSTESQILTAISNDTGGVMGAIVLSDAQVRDIAQFLGGIAVVTDYDVVEGLDVNGVVIEGIRIAVNGRANPTGQTYGCTWVDGATCKGGINATVATSGEQLHRQGAVIGRVSGPNLDQFNLEFGRLGDQQETRIEPAYPAVPGPLVTAPDAGVRDFAQVNDTMAALTGVPPFNGARSNAYRELKQSLPGSGNIESFVSTHAVSYLKLAVEYCDAMWSNNTRRQNFYGTTSPNNGQIVGATVDKMAGTNLTSQPARQDMVTVLDTLVGSASLGTTRQKAVGACTAMLASSVVQVR